MTGFSRRGVLRGLGLTSLGVVATTRGTRTAMAVSGWDDTTLTYSSSDGTLPSLELSASDLSFEFSYSNFPSGSTTVDVNLKACSPSHEYGTVLSGSFPVDGESDTLSLDGSRLNDASFPVDLLAQDSISESDFTADTGETREADVDFRVSFSAAGETITIETTCTVEVTNTSSATPSSVVAHYDASQEDYSDGDSVSTITDQDGGYDLSGGSATYVSNAINDSPAFRFSGTSHENTSLLVRQPNAIVALAKTTQPSTDGEYITDGINGRQILAFDLGSRHYASGIYAGSFVGGGSSTTDFTILSGIYNGANSEFRRNEVVKGTGGVGASDLDGLTVGALHGDVVEVLVLSDPSDVEASEQYLKDKHGV